MKTVQVRLQAASDGRFEVLGRAGRIGMVLGGNGVWAAEAGKARLGTAQTRHEAVQMVAIKAAVDGKLCEMERYDFDFVPAKVPDKAFDWRTYTEEPYLQDEATARALAERVCREEVFVSESFQVNVMPSKPKKEWPLMFHASIKRRDREAMLDRSALQEIKNALFGERFEGMELYPSGERVLDVANQYHLWVPAEEGAWLQVGRALADPVEIAMGDWVVRMQGLEAVKGSECPVAFRVDGRRRDARKERATDWRLLQQMKDQVLGARAEAVMVFPSSERKQKGRMEQALWVLKAGSQFPFGFETGGVGGEAAAERLGAKQRPMTGVVASETA